MYADREEEEIRKRQSRRRYTPSVSPVSRSVSRSLSPSRSPSVERNVSRERELQETLRRRALLSRTSDEHRRRSSCDSESSSRRRRVSRSPDRRRASRSPDRRNRSPRRSNYYPPPPSTYRSYDRYGPSRSYQPPPPPPRYSSPPSGSARRRRDRTPHLEDYEMRSVFCQQLAARLTQRDLGEFFEDKLGEGSVRDVRIVIDKITGRSKGVGYVELKEEGLVERALMCSGTTLFGIPIIVQKTDAARNRAASSTSLPSRPTLGLDADIQLNGEPIHFDGSDLPNASARLYVGNLHFSLGEAEIRSIFEPFGTIVNIDLHREPGTQKSKGYAFVQYTSSDVAEKAIEAMNGSELVGRNIKVGQVNAAKTLNHDSTGATATLTSSFDEGGGGGLTASSRAALMEKLAGVQATRTNDTKVPTENQPTEKSIPEAVSRGVLLKNMFNPEEEVDRGWDKELAEDVREECDAKYGKVDAIKVDALSSQGEIWLRFSDVEGAQKAVGGLNGRFFGGRSISASFISEGLLKMLS